MCANLAVGEMAANCLDCEFIQPLCDHIDRLATIHNYNNLYGA